MKRKREIGVGGALLIVVLLAIFAPDPPDRQVATPASEPRASSQSARQASPSNAPSLSPTKVTLERRSSLVHPSPNAKGDLFAAHSWDPPPVATPTVAVVPTAPPLPFAFIGKKRENGVWEVYLDDSGHVLTVRQNDIVEAAYKVNSIAPPTLELIYLPLGQRQTLTIGDPE